MPYLWLLPTVDVIVDGGKAFLIHPNGQVLEIDDPCGLVSDLFRRFDGKTNSNELQNNPLAGPITEQLISMGWVAQLSSPLDSILNDLPHLSREFTYLAHQYPEFPDARFAMLRTKRILIIGAGGVGTAVSFALCATGVKQIVIVDPDRVEESNLNRQFLYDRNSLGRPKALALAAALNARFPNTTIDGDTRDFDAPNVAESLICDIDLVVICGESRVLYRLPDLCSSTPILFAGYEGICGIVGPLIDPYSATACWPCFVAHHHPDKAEILESAAIERSPKWNPSGACINLAVGSFVSTIATRFLSQIRAPDDHWGRRLRISMNGLMIESNLCIPNRCNHTV